MKPISCPTEDYVLRGVVGLLKGSTSEFNMFAH